MSGKVDLVESILFERDGLRAEIEELRKQLQASYEQEVNTRGRTELREARDRWMNRARIAEKQIEALNKALKRIADADGSYSAVALQKVAREAIESAMGDTECGQKALGGR